jgi:hypothetical protein
MNSRKAEVSIRIAFAHGHINAKVSDGSQPPMALDLARELKAGSRSLHRLVGRFWVCNVSQLPSVHKLKAQVVDWDKRGKEIGKDSDWVILAEHKVG